MIIVLCVSLIVAFKCEKCDECFGQASELKLHIKTQEKIKKHTLALAYARPNMIIPPHLLIKRNLFFEILKSTILNSNNFFIL